MKTEYILTAVLGGVVALLGVSAIAMIFMVKALPVTEGAVVRVGIKAGVGSGVHIGKGVVITAAHVVEQTEGLQVDGKPAEVMWANTDYDLAAIQTTPGGPAAQLRCTGPVVGEVLTAYGYPGGFTLTQTHGHVAGKPFAMGEFKSVVVADLTVWFGNSGGPAFDSNGRVAAIVVAGLLGTGFSFLVPSTEVCRMLGR